MKIRVRQDLGQDGYWLEKRILFFWWPISFSFDKQTIFERAAAITLHGKNLTLKEWNV